MTPSEIRALRLKLDLTQAQMAERVGITRETYNAIERGRKEASGPVMRLLDMEYKASFNPPL